MQFRMQKALNDLGGLAGRNGLYKLCRRSADQAASRNQHQAIDQGHNTRGSWGAIKQELNLHLGIREVPRDIAGIARGASDQCVEGCTPGVHRMRDEVNVFDVK